jgi:hypothetical protein
MPRSGAAKTLGFGLSRVMPYSQISLSLSGAGFFASPWINRAAYGLCIDSPC